MEVRDRTQCTDFHVVEIDELIPALLVPKKGVKVGLQQLINADCLLFLSLPFLSRPALHVIYHIPLRTGIKQIAARSFCYLCNCRRLYIIRIRKLIAHT